jgi:hypothetical protein
LDHPLHWNPGTKIGVPDPKRPEILCPPLNFVPPPQFCAKLFYKLWSNCGTKTFEGLKKAEKEFSRKMSKCEKSFTPALRRARNWTTVDIKGEKDFFGNPD